MTLKEWYDGIAVLSLPVFLSLSPSLLARKLSLIHSNQKHSLTADEPRRTIGWKGICAFMGGTEAQFGKKKTCVLSSCLANTQLYTTDTIEQRRGLLTATNQFLCCCIGFLFVLVWFILVPKIIFTDNIHLCSAGFLKCDCVWCGGFVVCLHLSDLLARLV